MQFKSRLFPLISCSTPLSHILSEENSFEIAIVVVAQSSSVDRVPLIESFNGIINSSSNFPPENQKL